MRIAPLVLWGLGSILWLAWAILFVRLLLDLALGTPFLDSAYFEPVFFGLSPRFGWLDWRVNSWIPFGAMLGCALSAAAWRISHVLSDGLLPRRQVHQILSVLVPPLALLYAWQDALAHHRERNVELEADATAARRRLSGKM